MKDMNSKEKIMEELTLLLMYLSSWENDNPLEEKYKQSWKGYSFEVMNNLTDKGYLFPAKHSNKSVTFTKEGMDFAEELIKKYFNN